MQATENAGDGASTLALKNPWAESPEVRNREYLPVASQKWLHCHPKKKFKKEEKLRKRADKTLATNKDGP